MRVFYDKNDRWEDDALSFALGAAGGLVLGMFASRVVRQQPRIGGELRDRASTVARRLRPGRLRRLIGDQRILDQLEDRVLESFLGDEILMDRAIDIGAISHGIIELSGSVWSETEARRAVSLANSIPGVRSVVNRLDVDELGRRPRSGLVREEFGSNFTHTEGRTGGMGRRRQSAETDPDRTDDSQHRREEAMAAADRDQFEEEGLTHRTPRNNERPEVQATGRTRYRPDELDNQDPHQGRARTLDSPPQATNPDARVGEGMKPATRRDIENADLSIDQPAPRDNEG